MCILWQHQSLIRQLPNKLWDNREQPHSTPNILRNQQQYQANSKISVNTPGNAPQTGNMAGNTNCPASPHHLATFQEANAKISGHSALNTGNNHNTQSNFSSRSNQGYQNHQQHILKRNAGTNGSNGRQ